MSSYSLGHLADHVLLRDLAALVSDDRVTTARLLAHLAEVDTRRLYAPEGYPSMYHYCVGKLRLSEDAAAKRIQAARAARRYPAIFVALADGRLHLSAVVLLAPHLTPETADELLTAAALKTKAGIERLLAERFPRPDLPSLVRPLAPALVLTQHAPGHVAVPANLLSAVPMDDSGAQNAPRHVASAPVASPTPGPAPEASAAHASMPLGPLAPRPRVAPLSPGRFSLQVTISEPTHDKLRYAQALLGHAVPSGDVAQVLDRALDALIKSLEQRRFAARARTSPRSRRRGTSERYLPASVRREVWQRDQGRCTFVSDKGHRCEARTRLEFDHVQPLARGGPATGSNLRLRCRAHNQYAADCVYGAGFMREKRERSRHAPGAVARAWPSGSASGAPA